MYAVELNSETLPRVLMDKAYYAEVTALAMRDKEKEFISECAASATWLIKSLDQRARTILKVASEIVRQQDGFFAHGVAHLRPLNLKQVADAIEMHESTVSRVTTNKFIATPHGIFELKYFFTSAIPASGGGDAHSAEAVRHRIKSLIDAEKSDEILSDDRIVELLKSDGIDIARRTVAKYREAMSIASSDPARPARPTYSTLMSATPARRKSSASATFWETSSTRPPWNGPRSFTRTMIEWLLRMFVTRA
jgi:RNA polymerase sigma-54 factor